jgi:coproporphyrinogen III oxidase
LQQQADLGGMVASSDFTEEKAQAAAWFRSLRDQIVAAFEGLEDR